MLWFTTHVSAGCRVQDDDKPFTPCNIRRNTCLPAATDRRIHGHQASHNDPRTIVCNVTRRSTSNPQCQERLRDKRHRACGGGSGSTTSTTHQAGLGSPYTQIPPTAPPGSRRRPAWGPNTWGTPYTPGSFAMCVLELEISGALVCGETCVNELIYQGHLDVLTLAPAVKSRRAHGVGIVAATYKCALFKTSRDGQPMAVPACVNVSPRCRQCYCCLHAQRRCFLMCLAIVSLQDGETGICSNLSHRLRCACGLST